LQRELRLRKREDFRKVYQRGKSIANRYLVMYQFDNPQLASYRFGISISKKIGNAVERNRIKRLIKEAIRSILEQYEIKLHKDFVFIARKPITELGFNEIKKNIEYLFNKLHLLKRKQGE